MVLRKERYCSIFKAQNPVQRMYDARPFPQYPQPTTFPLPEGFPEFTFAFPFFLSRIYHVRLPSNLVSASRKLVMSYLNRFNWMEI